MTTSMEPLIFEMSHGADTLDRPPSANGSNDGWKISSVDILGTPGRKDPENGTELSLLASKGNNEPGRTESPSKPLAPAAPSQYQAVHTVSQAKPGRSRALGQQSDEAWELRKAEIKRLYLGQDRSLKEVRNILEAGGFKATQKMFKYRVMKWGFYKYNRKDDIAAMLQVQRQRSAVGKRTSFHRNGKTIDIDGYLKRKGLTRFDIASVGTGENLAEYVRYHTPPPEYPRYLPSSGTQSIQETFLQCARELTWKSATKNELCPVSIYCAYMQSEFSFSMFELMDAEALFSRGYFKHGGMLCQHAFRDIHKVVTDPSVLSLVDLLMSQRFLSRGLLEQVGQYLAHWPTTMHPQNALHRLLKGLNQFVQENTLETYWGLIAECIGNFALADEHNLNLPPETSSTLCSLILSGLEYDCKMDTLWERLYHRLNSNRASVTSNGGRNRQRLFFQAIRLVYLAKKSGYQEGEVLELANELLEDIGKESSGAEFEVYFALKAIAMFHRSYCDKETASYNPRHLLARYYLQRAVDHAESVFDTDSDMINDLEVLEAWHREAGYHNVADEIHSRFEQCLSLLESAHLDDI